MLGLLQLGEQLVVFDGVVDAGGGQHGVEPASGGGGVVFGQDGFDDRPFGQSFAGFGRIFAFGLEVVHMEAQHVGVFNGVGDGVGVELLLEQVFGRSELPFFTLELLGRGVRLEDGRAGKAKDLSLGKELFDGIVVRAKLGAVAFVKNKNDALVAQGAKLLFVGGLAVFLLLLVALAVFRPAPSPASGWW